MRYSARRPVRSLLRIQSDIGDVQSLNAPTLGCVPRAWLTSDSREELIVKSVICGAAAFLLEPTKRVNTMIMELTTLTITLADQSRMLPREVQLVLHQRRLENTGESGVQIQDRRTTPCASTVDEQHAVSTTCSRQASSFVQLRRRTERDPA